MPLLVQYHAPVPRPLTDRQKWEEELTELPLKVAEHQAALAALVPVDRKWRDFHTWLLRLAQKRMADLEARLASM